MERTPARLLAGGPIASEIRQAVAEDVATFRAVEGRPPDTWLSFTTTA